MKELKAITDLIQALKIVPGIGNKSAERIAYELLKSDTFKVQNLIDALNAIKDDIDICPICGSYQEKGVCPICSNPNRDSDVLVVVTSFKDVLAFERLNTYHGKYHILNGSISPTKGITATDLNLTQLITRIKDENIKEVILATNPTLDGETTALYIAKLLEKMEDVKLSRLAYGLPMGATLDYTDELTLIKALEGRTSYKK